MTQEGSPTAAIESREPRFAIIGAGMAGILSAIKLKEAGLTKFTVYEKAGRVGGTWRENTYPGLSCDVPSHLYCFSFAPNPNWSHTFSPGPEIEDYLERVARERGVLGSIRFNEEVRSCEFADGRWQVVTSGGSRQEVDVVIAATGVLHHPKYPDIEGLESFRGKAFHSARWDHSAILDGARIGVVGTGSTAVQLVTAIVDRVVELHLFQRTAQWIMPAANPAYSDAEKEEFRQDPHHLADVRSKLSDLFDGFSNAVIDADSPQMSYVEETCRANLEDNVTDPVLRERLRPDYRAACKRLILATDFYTAIQSPHAHLVTEPIEVVEPTGVRTVDGELHELDVLVLATGFKVDAFMRPMSVIGRDGRSLEDAWAKRPEAYLSISIPDFPNFFMLNGPNGPVGNFSLIEVAELQFGYIMQLVEELRSGRCAEISATRSAMEDFEARRADATKKTIWATGCRSWYLDDRGVPASWPWPFPQFREEMAKPRLEAFERR